MIPIQFHFCCFAQIQKFIPDNRTKKFKNSEYFVRVSWYFVLQFVLIFGGFLKLYIEYTCENTHVKLKNVRIQKLN